MFHNRQTITAVVLFFIVGVVSLWMSRDRIVGKHSDAAPLPGRPSEASSAVLENSSPDSTTASPVSQDQRGITMRPEARGSKVSADASNRDPADFQYPMAAGQLEKIGTFEEREVRAYRHPDGSLRVHRLVHTGMKYPLVLVEEVFSRDSGTLARQTISVGDHLMVQFADGVDRPSIEAAVSGAGFSVRKWFQQPGLVLVEIPDAKLDSLEQSRSKISALPQIEFVERDDLVFAN